MEETVVKWMAHSHSSEKLKAAVFLLSEAKMGILPDLPVQKKKKAVYVVVYGKSGFFKALAVISNIFKTLHGQRNPPKPYMFAKRSTN